MPKTNSLIITESKFGCCSHNLEYLKQNLMNDERFEKSKLRTVQLQLIYPNLYAIGILISPLC